MSTELIANRMSCIVMSQTVSQDNIEEGILAVSKAAFSYLLGLDAGWAFLTGRFEFWISITESSRMFAAIMRYEYVKGLCCKCTQNGIKYINDESIRNY